MPLTKTLPRSPRDESPKSAPEAAAAAGFAVGEHQEFAEAKLARNLGAGLAAHETIQVAGQLALGRDRIGLLQQLDDGEAQHTVAHELKALVILARLLGAAQA